jgi:sulfonate transport system substrate-binding protein
MILLSGVVRNAWLIQRTSWLSQREFGVGILKHHKGDIREKWLDKTVIYDRKKPSRPGRAIFIILLVALLAIATVILWGRGSHSSLSTAQDILRVGDQPGGERALLTAAGELKNLPYHIEWSRFPAASPVLEALGSDAIDLGSVGGPPFGFAYAGGAKIKAILAWRSATGHGSRASGIVVGRGSAIRKPADLKGKKLATVRGSAGHDLALRLLGKAGLGSNDVEWVFLSNNDAKAALSSGAVDAWSTWASYFTVAVQGGDRVLADATSLPASYLFLAASDQAIAQKRPLIEDYLRRIIRARAWVRQHPDAYAAVLTKETGMSLESAKFLLDSYLVVPLPIDEKVEREQIRVFERYRTAGIIPALPNVKGAYDRSFSKGLAPAPD